MLDVETKRRIDTARDILVGKIPDPKSQVEQITIALVYKFMDDMDEDSRELGGKATFFKGEFQKYAWHKIFDPKISGIELVNAYGEAIQRMNQNPNIPQLFRDIFKNAYLPYRDPETLKSFLKVIGEFEYNHSERLGDAFEYLLSVLGSQGEAGQFRTPRHIIDFMVEIIDPKKTETVLDPACGTAGFLISSFKHILKHNSKNFDPEKDRRAFELRDVNLEEITINNKQYKGDKLSSDDKERLVNNIKGYDISPDMVRLSLVNMYLHEFKNPKIAEYDTLTSEDKWGEYADVILANPPFMSPKGGIRPHKKFSIQSNRSEVLFVDYIAEHLTSQGRSCVIVPEGIIFQSQTAHTSLREMLIEKNYLVGVISLPAGLFNPYSGVKTSILWLDRALAKKTDKILFVKIENDGFNLGAQRRPIKDNDLPEAFRAICAYKDAVSDGKKFNAEKWQNVIVVEKDKISENEDYNLIGERYKPTLIGVNQKYPISNLGNLISTLTPPKKIQTSNFSSKGKYPVIDQSQENISGWSDDDSAVVNSLEPVVIFGDHTCAVKYHDGPFVQGADGIKIIQTVDTLLPKYLFYCLKYRPLPTSGYQRHFSKLKEYKIPLPPLSAQEEIVAEIEGYQKIVDGARQVVENYKPHIDIDPGWPIVELEKLCQFTYGYADAGLSEGDVRFIRITDIANTGLLRDTDAKYIKLTDEAKGYLLSKGDLLVARTGATYGKTLYFDYDFPAVYASYLIKIDFDKSKIIPKYYWIFTLSVSYDIQKRKLMTGGGQPQFNANALKQITIPVPPIEMQRQIISQVETEQFQVIANTKLIEAFQEKITKRIAQVWGEK